MGTPCSTCPGLSPRPQGPGAAGSLAGRRILLTRTHRVWKVPLPFRLAVRQRQRFHYRRFQVHPPPQLYRSWHQRGPLLPSESFFLVTQEERYPLPKVEMPLTLPVGQAQQALPLCSRR